MRKIYSGIFIMLILSTINGYSQSVKRIVSLIPSLTKNLYLLESDRQLVGCTSYCKQPENRKIEVVASAININLEKIITLKPDVVIASDLNKPSSIETLKKLGIKVVKFPTPKSFLQINEQFMKLAQLIGQEKNADKILAREQQRIDSLLNLVPKDIHPSIFFEIGAKPLYTVIPNTFMDDYITYCGGTNVASDLKQGSITRESVLLRNPDVIFVVTMGIVGKEEKEAWKMFTDMSAAKNNKIFVIDSSVACEPTPVNFTKTLERMIQLMY